MSIGHIDANASLTERCIANITFDPRELELGEFNGRRVTQLKAGRPRGPRALKPIKKLSLFKRILAAVLPCCFRRYRFECGMNDFNQHLGNTFRLLNAMADEFKELGTGFNASAALEDLMGQCRRMRADAMWATRNNETYRTVVQKTLFDGLTNSALGPSLLPVTTMLRTLQEELRRRPDATRQMVRDDPALDALLKERNGAEDERDTVVNWAVQTPGMSPEELKQQQETEQKIAAVRRSLERPNDDGEGKVDGGNLVDVANANKGLEIAERAIAAAKMYKPSVISICKSTTYDSLDVVTDPALAKNWLSDIVGPGNVERCCKAIVGVMNVIPRSETLTESLLGHLTEQIVSNTGKESTDDSLYGKVFRALSTAICERHLVTRQIPKKLWTALKNLAADSKSNPSPNIGRDHLGRFVKAYRSVYHTAYMSWPDEAPTGELDSGGFYVRMLRLAKESYASETEEGKKTLAESAKKLLPNIGDAHIYSDDWHDADTGFVTALLNFLIDGGHAAV